MAESLLIPPTAGELRAPAKVEVAARPVPGPRRSLDLQPLQAADRALGGGGPDLAAGRDEAIAGVDGEPAGHSARLGVHPVDARPFEPGRSRRRCRGRGRRSGSPTAWCVGRPGSSQPRCRSSDRRGRRRPAARRSRRIRPRRRSPQSRRTAAAPSRPPVEIRIDAREHAAGGGDPEGARRGSGVARQEGVVAGDQLERQLELQLRRHLQRPGIESADRAAPEVRRVEAPGARRDDGLRPTPAPWCGRGRRGPDGGCG